MLSELEQEHSSPKMILNDNGPEFTSKAILSWAAQNNIIEQWRIDCNAMLSNLTQAYPLYLGASKTVRVRQTLDGPVGPALPCTADHATYQPTNPA